MKTTTPKPLEELRSSLQRFPWPREWRERGKVQVRAAGDGRTLEMFVPFASESVDMGFREIIDPGAFTRSIRAGRNSNRFDIFALWSHDSSQPLARQANKTLEFEERSDGLAAVATLQPDIDYHDRALKAVGAGLVRGTSFGFETVRDEWEYDEDGEATRTLLEVKLFEVSPVVFPAYQESDVEARSALAQARAAMGVDPAELLGILREVRDGQLPADRHVSLKGWVARLGAIKPLAEPAVPAPEIADDYWDRRLKSRERLLAGKA